MALSLAKSASGMSNLSRLTVQRFCPALFSLGNKNLVEKFHTAGCNQATRGEGAQNCNVRGLNLLRDPKLNKVRCEIDSRNLDAVWCLD